jgi:cellobiose phosphorylase
VRPVAGGWRLDPHIPTTWPEYELVLRDGDTIVRIVVENPRGVSSGIRRMHLDGEVIEAPIVPRLKDGRMHEVRITLG